MDPQERLNVTHKTSVSELEAEITTLQAALVGYLTSEERTAATNRVALAKRYLDIRRTGNAQRQQDFRDRQRQAGENGRRRVELWLATGAALALKRLAKHQGVARNDYLDCLLLGTQEVVTEGMTDEEHERFFQP